MRSAALLVRHKINGIIYLQQIAGALCASVNRQTGFTAYRLMLGREVNMTAHLMFPQVGDNYKDAGNYVNQLTAKLHQAHETARTKLKHRPRG